MLPKYAVGGGPTIMSIALLAKVHTVMKPVAYINASRGTFSPYVKPQDLKEMNTHFHVSCNAI
jgi:hypothetical protein